MPHSYISNRLHVVFSTEGRRPLISADLQPKLWSYLAAIGKNKGVPVFATGGTENHVHLLIALPPTMTLAKAVQVIKANSSKWVRETDPRFSWQEGYGGVSVSASAIDAVTAYIHGQAEHHRKHSFEAEFRAWLVKSGIPFDERYVFG
jgi:putative transposase